MPQTPGGLGQARARRLRAAGEAGLRRHLDHRLGSRATALVERPGRARDADFTEIAFAGEAPPGTLIGGAIARHDGRSARLETWEVQ
jgi:threonylcarbamoyladenosine tRNA methylthiotransferase MtaB